MDRYIPIIGAAAAFLVTALSGYIIIPFLHKLKFGQTILDIGPKWHKKKQGTPTMGGIIFLIRIKGDRWMKRKIIPGTAPS